MEVFLKCSVHIFFLLSYGSFLTETSCPNLRKTLEDNMKTSAADQFSVFNAMQSRGYYQTKEAPQQEVDQAKEKFGNILGDMN